MDHSFLSLSLPIDMKKMHQFGFLLKSAFRFLIILAIQLYVLPTYFLWNGIIFAPLRFIRPKLFWKLEGILYKMMISFIGAWVTHVGYEIAELGDDLTPCYQEPSLLLVNHQSTADVPLLMAAFTNKKQGVLASTMWIISNIFRYTNFGLVSMLRGDFFITQGKSVRDAQLLSLRSHLQNNYLSSGKKWIVLFPEGGFLSKRRESSLKYSKKNGFKPMYNVTLPRVGAMNTILETLLSDSINTDEKSDNRIKWLIDVTIAYPDGDPLHLTSACTLIPRPPRKTYFIYRRFPISEVPRKNYQEVQEWLFDRWEEKENFLEKYYRTGQFPCEPKSEDNFRVKGIDQETKVPLLNPLKPLTTAWVSCLHIIFLLSTLFNGFLMQSLWKSFSTENGPSDTLLAVHNY